MKPPEPCSVDIYTCQAAEYLPDDEYTVVWMMYLVNSKTYKKIKEKEPGPEFDEYIKHLKRFGGGSN